MSAQPCQNQFPAFKLHFGSLCGVPRLALFKKKNLPKPDNWQQNPGRNTSHEQFRGSFKCQTEKSSPRFHPFPLAVRPIQSPELACAAFRNASSSSFPFLTLIAATKWPCPFPHSAAPPLSLPSAPCRWKLIHDRCYVLKRAYTSPHCVNRHHVLRWQSLKSKKPTGQM